MMRFDLRWPTLVVLVVVFVVVIYRVPAAAWLTLGMGQVLDMLHVPTQQLQSLSLWFEDRHQLQTENERLRLRVQQQAAVVQQARALGEENRQLKALLQITHIEGFHWHAAKVLGRSPDTMSQRLILQTGHASEDDVIVSSEGLVGLVASADQQHAVVRTILDASVSVPVTVPGTPLAGLVRGQGDSLEVDFLLWEQVPAAGSVLYTSGAGGLFPPGLAVARIVRAEAIPGQVFAHVTAVPAAHWQRDNWLAIANRGPVVDE